jgi:bidirectional [NiFe] hydrogenase diaphorase subunit
MERSNAFHDASFAVTIDGQQIQVPKDTTALEAARSLNIDIPTLCYHPALAPYGQCRLCLVEVKKGNRSRIVTSCNYPIREDGLVIETRSPRVLSNRRMVVELLLARCPKVPLVQELAEELGVSQPRFPTKDENEDCVLCGLCVRVCEEVIGASAISFVGRGPGRKVMTPYDERSEDCLGCGACAFVCPTGAIAIEDVLNMRRMLDWHTELERQTCRRCGKPFAPEVALERLGSKVEFLKDILDVCPDCRRELFGTQFVVGTRVSPDQTVSDKRRKYAQSLVRGGTE